MHNKVYKIKEHKIKLDIVASERKDIGSNFKFSNDEESFKKSLTEKLVLVEKFFPKNFIMTALNPDRTPKDIQQDIIVLLQDSLFYLFCEHVQMPTQLF